MQLPFELVPSAFLRRAQRMAPSAAEATASGFASWLYSLYSNEYGDQEDKERGREIEPKIFARRREMQGSVNDDFLRSIDSGWRLVHNGLHVPGQDHVPWFTIGSLRVNGEPLRASPDLIYHHARFNEVLIVEIKHSYMSIPSNLWPNVWGQLWCYSQLDIARTADRVTVIGEVWGERGLWLGRDRDYDDDVLHMRASVRRNPRSPTFDRFFRALFDIYSSAPPPGQVD
ncbi:hypothetical protein [Ralstonia holmesii]|uniref:hypothetical protein n=1 Tax=Ralstonia holmesii TaxID=3058602 RepID=UPI00292EBD3A|nr:hypothetical protein [Ralstonia sp. LMG 32967]